MDKLLTDSSIYLESQWVLGLGKNKGFHYVPTELLNPQTILAFIIASRIVNNINIHVAKQTEQ